MHPSLILSPTSSNWVSATAIQVVLKQSKKTHKRIIGDVARCFRVSIEIYSLQDIVQLLELLQEDENLVRLFQLWVYSKKLLDKDESFSIVDVRL